MKRAPHLAYSPDVSASYFYLFGYFKNKLNGEKFETADQLYDTIKNGERNFEWHFKQSVSRMDEKTSTSYWQWWWLQQINNELVLFFLTIFWDATPTWDNL